MCSANMGQDRNAAKKSPDHEQKDRQPLARLILS